MFCCRGWCYSGAGAATAQDLSRGYTAAASQDHPCGYTSTSTHHIGTPAFPTKGSLATSHLLVWHEPQHRWDEPVESQARPQAPGSGTRRSRQQGWEAEKRRRHRYGRVCPQTSWWVRVTKQSGTRFPQICRLSNPQCLNIGWWVLNKFCLNKCRYVLKCTQWTES